MMTGAASSSRSREPRGDRAEALRIAERAAVICLRADDPDEVGKALVAQGIWLYYLGRPDEALEALKTALGYLAEDSARNRFAAFQVSGLAYQSMSDFSGALRMIEAAREALPAGDEWARGKLLWLRARLCADIGFLDDSSAMLDEVIGIFRNLHHGETTLAICELVRLHLARGRREAAYETATATRAVLDPLRRQRNLSAAIGTCCGTGRTG